jgi:antitoxin component YwqK of YwqJK toxin-antitoxin module
MTGDWLFFYDNGRKKRLVSFQDGLPKREVRRWYDNGQLAFERTDLGLESSFQANGRITERLTKPATPDGYGFRVQFKDDMVSGRDGAMVDRVEVQGGGAAGWHVLCTFHRGGAPSELSIFGPQGREGPWVSWWSDGRPRLESVYEQGKPLGLERFYSPEGKLAAEGSYQKGKPWSGTFIMEFELVPSVREVLIPIINQIACMM